MKPRYLLVDDEPLALARLERLIREVEPTAQCTTAANGPAALLLLGDGIWEAVFLDVEMPGLSGFDVLARMPEGVTAPPVIFCTAYPRYAVKAFEESALHFLVKPVDASRVRTALARATRAAVERRPAATPGGFLTFKVGDRVTPVAWTDVLYLRADRKMTAVVTADGEFLTEKSLDVLETELPGDVFFRCHRSALVNLQHVLSVHAGEEPYVLLRQSHAVPVSRRRRTLLLKALKTGRIGAGMPSS